ncbi:MAG TPA: UDP-N-acetylglucosamine 2-epimerase (non-hydrolyzing) [Elusimicrobiota bacterium]|nr:UDP-N-acetylglucosamine 2-epimerase (non-hydrolyzing) [Elusimicrobiota bacterium]HMU95357.1 UDP-N-acetylglucosamine 2-epimerase (non-hydrolyzing) [Elusimicrobiota bacterium]HMZ25689.1 UDP-N-acetylglucosamine 2-epimerase (non-hydrolyzing) [Elusimicrobiota bacterium]HNC73650.1 UDP-N-acetylglucosamine 2-epimerase (non-hydrolyzing) [Elusimicrobiota bacterium]HND63479.1 UDP-N-acetylglucosamine 2-epimerase (non-hydrolyzing) [Elusimicrobiota bacterium]
MKRSTPKKILFVFGTRPEAIKMAPVILALRKRPAEFNVRIAVTAQHRDLLDPVLKLFGIRPHHDLGIMRPGQSLTDVSVRALSRLEPVIRSEKPDLVLVHGDTTTALMGALAAFYQRVPVGHVEAGLRSGDDANPFPEEANRRLTDGLSVLHFAPTVDARRNLLREGRPASGVVVTGNTAVDALDLGLARLGSQTPALPPGVARIARGPFVLATVHRRENFGRPLEEICEALGRVARARPDRGFVLPVHPNPNVGAVVRKILGSRSNVALTAPLEYGPMIYLLKKSLFVVTDSGGIQEEAPSLGKPVLVVRRVTERPEAVRAGVARVIGTDGASVQRRVERLLDDGPLYRRMARRVHPFGDGRAAERIRRGLVRFFRSQR